MADFYWEEYVHNYEIDYYNDTTEEEKLIISSKTGLKPDDLSCYYKTYDGWSQRISGNIYNIKNMPWYDKLKKHLDSEFETFLRKKKLEKIKTLYETL